MNIGCCLVVCQWILFSNHGLSFLKEAVQTMVHISKNLSATVSDGRNVSYKNFCGHYCDSNVVVGYFLQALYQKTLNPESMTLQLTYPIADLRGIKLHLERNFYGLISMSFMAEMKTEADTERLGAWELTLFDFCYNYTANSYNKLEIQVIGAEIVDTEMNKDGFSIMFAFVCITVSGSSLYFDRLRWSTILVAVSCAIVPVLAITTTFGLCSLIGNRTNSLMLIMPFLIMGIGW
ncbi:unnamed protein product [Haemonchus placei]|uniref:SSD domain-containing protein n=1 Tax=Haemonchus placei TaxID=6290 RepID=A0A158QQ68_HAEPC|nr:unnamed protein product [Haemonchus placei]